MTLHPETNACNTAAADQQRHWEQVYAAKQFDQVSWFQAAPVNSLALIRSAGIASDAPIVDVGGGASMLVDALIAAEYHSITVLDLAATALEQAQQRLGAAAARVQWLQADVLVWRPTNLFQLWHDRAVFHFLVEEKDRQAYCKTLRAALAPGASVVLATFALDGPARCSGLPVRRYSPQMLAAELGPGFDLLETATEQHATPSGATQSFVYCRFQQQGCEPPS